MVASRQAKYAIFNRVLEESDADGVKDARTLDRYFMDGLMTAALCGAGSFYMLLLLASSRIRPEIRKVTATMRGRIAKLIRCPPGKNILARSSMHLMFVAIDSPIGRKITRFIIPAITHLWQLYPISLKAILPVESLYLGATVSELIDCRDIDASDAILDSLLYK